MERGIVATKAKTKRPVDFYALWHSRGFSNRTELAKAIGVARVTVWRWESGRQAMTAAQCRAVAKVLGVSMETVIESIEGVAS